VIIGDDETCRREDDARTQTVLILLRRSIRYPDYSFVDVVISHDQGCLLNFLFVTFSCAQLQAIGMQCALLFAARGPSAERKDHFSSLPGTYSSARPARLGTVAGLLSVVPLVAGLVYAGLLKLPKIETP